jgi:hypothetical protein
MQPGKHILLDGITGGGKTNFLNWIVQGLYAIRSTLPSEQWETICWFDRGKNSEILELSKFAPLRLLVPQGCNMEIFFDEEPLHDIEYVNFSSPEQLWQLLDRDRINIFCIQRFLADPSKFSPVVARLFKSLILQTFNYAIHPKNSNPKTLLPPIALFVDELNNIAPSKGQGTGSKSESNAGAWIQNNVEQLRGHRIRIIGSTHGWRKIRPGVRSSFNIIVALPGSSFPSSEKPKLSRFNRVFEKLKTGQAIIIFDSDIFSDPILIPWLGQGQSLGYILYHGQMGQKNN